MKVAVVVAAYDERETIEALIRRIRAALDGRRDVDWRLVLVVEGEDGTREIVDRLAASDCRIEMLYARQPSGLGEAFRRGFAAVPADVEWVVTLDADLNHQPEEIPRLLDEAAAGELDVLVGSRVAAGSRVDGTPLWKRVLSGTFNRFARPLLGVGVRDATSGFRVYRRSVLPAIVTSTRGFAFLPELLVEASKRELRLAETPIHFAFRTEGQSKMDLLATTRSYLRLLPRRLDRRALAIGGLLAVGCGLRLAMAFPVYRYAAESDGLLGPITALRALDGEWPVFQTPPRLGAIGGYLLAAMFAVLGSGRAVIHLAPLLVGLVTMVVWALLCRELVGRERLLPALAFVALASPAVLFWTSMPNSYPEVMLLCALILWLAVRIERRGATVAGVAALGLAIGLGWWQSAQTLGCSAPAILWLALRRRRLLSTARLAAGILGVVVGAAPWIAFNVVTRGGTLEHNFTARPAESREQVVDNAAYYLGYSIPELVASAEPGGSVTPSTSVTRGLRWVVFGGVLTLVLAAGLRGWRTRAPGTVSLAVLVGIALFGLNVLSAAGALRGLTVRYVTPTMLVVPPLVALGAAALARWGRWAWVPVAGAMFVLDLLALPLPGSAPRARLTHDLQVQRQLVAAVAASDARVVVGEFWTIYPLNFYLREQVTAIPWHRLDDHLLLEATLPAEASGPLCVVAKSEEAAVLRIARAGLLAVVDEAPDGVVVVATGGRSPAEVIARLRYPSLRRPVLFRDGFEDGTPASWSTPEPLEPST